MKDGVKNVFSTLGASNHSDKERPVLDYYATDPRAVERLLDVETFCNKIWEPACGGGHMSNVLKARGFKVYSTDIVNRGYAFQDDTLDFLAISGDYDLDIITNPPYSDALDFVYKSLELVTEGHKVAMLLRLLFLESRSRRLLFDQFPPKTIWVSSERINCAKDGDPGKSKGSAVAYAWFIWEKGYQGETILKWF